MSSVNKNSIAIACIAALFGLLSFHGLAPAQAQGEDNSQSRLNPPQAQYTTEGVEGCLRCHLGDRIALMAETAHGNRDNPHTPYATNGCESCHGPGSFHSSRARGGVGFPALLAFRPWEATELNDQACVNCHGKDMGELAGLTKWKGSIHQSRGMSCVYCHQLHTADDGQKDYQVQREQCSKCHARKLETHPVLTRDGEPRPFMANAKCSACHTIHELTYRE